MNLPTTSVLFALLLLPALSGQMNPVAAKPDWPEDRRSGALTIDEERLRAWLTMLSSKPFAGRGTGTNGYRLAAEMMREHFKSLGLQPAGDEDDKSGEKSYWQTLPWISKELAKKQSHFHIRQGKEQSPSLSLNPGTQLRGNVHKDLLAKGQLCLWQPGEEWQMEESQVKDKVVLVYFPPKTPSILALRRTTGITSKLKKAGAVQVIHVHDGLCAMYPTLQGREGIRQSPGNRTAAARNRRPTVLTMKVSTMQKILVLGGMDPKQPMPQGITELAGLELDLQIKLHEVQKPAYNVCALLPGSDPVLRDEFVVIGCHLDHLGRAKGQIYPGADDDGSGCAGLMALAQAFAKNQQPPRRSILFLAFCAEEKGLLGSKYYVEHPTVPLEKVVAELQMDMIGRSEEGKNEKAEDNRNSLHLIGSQKLAPELHELCLRRNEALAGFDLEWDEEKMLGRSDHFNFVRLGIPIAFFFTGLHKDYHKPSDTVEKIDFPKLRRVCGYVYDIAFELAQQDGRPLVERKLWQGLRGRRGGKPLAPTRN